MPIGSHIGFWYRKQNPSFKSRAMYLYFRLFGTPDLHTHIRWRACKNFLGFKASSVLDIGCGSGVISLELGLKNSQIKVIGIDLDKKAISRANSIKEVLKLKNVEFHHLSATATYPYQNSSFDMVLLIDIIEHVSNPQTVIAEVSRVLKPGGTVVVSVPTPNYPKFFGYKFHKEIGHLVDGYWLEDIERMLSLYNIHVTEYSYYTYPPASVVCALFYRYLRNSIIGMLSTPLLNVISYLESFWPLRSGRFACSLAVKAEKAR